VFTAGAENDRFVHKQCTWENEDTRFNRIDYEAMRMDMLVGEIFSSNPMFVDIYGYCALSMFSEYMPHGDASTLAQPHYERGYFNRTSAQLGVTPLNDLTPKVKLVWAYEMAKSVSYLHNYPGGVLVHDDIQLPQFLIKDNGHLKLNDFNRAEPMLYDEENHEYCRYRNNPGHGDVSTGTIF
jgi:serine/threonine protein kinase